MSWLKKYPVIYLKGIAMGIADAIPGVSGGTIALITGIYEQLINSIKSFDLAAITYLRKFRFRDLWRHVNGDFLLTLVFGIATSLVTLSHFVTFILREYPIQIWSFFFGLIIISSVVVLRRINRWNPKVIISLSIGVAAAFLITMATPAQTPDDLWFIFISGSIAIIAMILPGISGAFILLLLGKYEYVYMALRDLDLVIIGVFIAGAIAGILSFSRAVSFLLRKYHNSSIALLSGFMIGSLNKIWPWKIVTLFKENSGGEQIPLVEKNVFPALYFQETGNNPYIFQAILFIALGIFIVVLLEKISISRNKTV
jgi:putative membrane protein